MSKEIELDYDTLQALENENLSYKEMADKLGLKLKTNNLSRRFKKYGIKHKTKKERIRERVLNDKGSIAYLARKYHCCKDTIWRILKENKNDKVER